MDVALGGELLDERLAGDGLLEFEGNAVRLTARGRMVSNDVFQEFLGLDEGDSNALDLVRPEVKADVSTDFDLGSSGHSNIAADKDAMVAEAFAASRK